MKSIAITTIVLTILGGIGFVAYLSDRQPEGDSLSAAPAIRPAQGGTGTSTAPTTDQILIGIGSGVYGLKQIVAGTDISISTSSNRITINSTASVSGSGELSDWEQVGGFLTPTTTIGIDVNGTSTLATTTIDSLDVIASFTSDFATALAANGANCSSGNAPLGVDASGAVESCFDVWTEAENTAAAYLSSVDISDNTNLTVTATGLELSSDAIALSAGYAIPTTTRLVQYDEAYSWGDHALAGYQSAISVTHPILLSGATLSLAFSTTTANSWSQLQTFTYASTTALTVLGNSFFDGTATFGGNVSVHGGTWNAGGIDLASGDDYEINGTDVLTATGLGSGVLSSSLTSLGTIANFTSTNATSTNLHVSGRVDLASSTESRLVTYGFTVPGTPTTTTATTTFRLPPALEAQNWMEGSCYTTNSTASFVFTDDGTNDMNARNASTTVGTFALTTNNSFIAYEKRGIEVGALTNSILSCSVKVHKNP